MAYQCTNLTWLKKRLFRYCLGCSGSRKCCNSAISIIFNISSIVVSLYEMEITGFASMFVSNPSKRAFIADTGYLGCSGLVSQYMTCGGKIIRLKNLDNVRMMDSFFTSYS